MYVYIKIYIRFWPRRKPTAATPLPSIASSPPSRARYHPTNSTLRSFVIRTSTYTPQTLSPTP